MKDTRIVGAVDEEGNPKQPVYALGKVINRGEDLPNGLNHADYIIGEGHYDILRQVQYCIFCPN